MRTFSELKNDVAVLVQRSGDSDYLDKIGDWLNDAQTFLASKYDYFTVLQGVFNFTTTDGIEDYFLPNDLDIPLRIYDITNNNKLTMKTEEAYFDANIANIIDANTGKPTVARVYGSRGVKVAIGSSGTTLQVKSSSASDTGNIIVRVEGYIDSDKSILDFENITISSGSPTTFVAGTKTFYDITKVSKDQNTTGYITLANSVGTTLSILSSIDRILEHRILKLGLIPNATISMRVLYKKKVRKLVDDNDYPFIESDEFLIARAYGYSLLQSKEETFASQAAFKQANAALQNVLNNQANKFGPSFQHKITNSLTLSHRS